MVARWLAGNMPIACWAVAQWSVLAMLIWLLPPALPSGTEAEAGAGRHAPAKVVGGVRGGPSQGGPSDGASVVAVVVVVGMAVV